MDKFDRLYQLHHKLSGRRQPIALQDLAEHLECTPRTVNRYLTDLENYFQAPIQRCPPFGVKYSESSGNRFELPGLWMTPQEVQSLTLLLDILDRFGNGLFADELNFVEQRINNSLQQRGISRSSLDERIRVIPLGNRIIADKNLHNVFRGIVERKVIRLRYSDYKHSASNRDVCPQRLTYYRDNWYLDAWCQSRKALRTFTLSRIESSKVMSGKARDIDSDALDAHFKPGYGVFAGAGNKTVHLRFSREVARDVAQQQWHPDQVGNWEGKDYLLRLPYADDRELITDILRYTPHVYVEKPVALRKKVQNKLQQGLELNLGRGLGWL